MKNKQEGMHKDGVPKLKPIHNSWNLLSKPESEVIKLKVSLLKFYLCSQLISGQYISLPYMQDNILINLLTKYSILKTLLKFLNKGHF